MVNFNELAASLLSPNVGVVLKALGELRERIEIVHTSDFSVFLQKIFPILRDLILTRLNPQFADNAENKCRQIVLEIFIRFPNSDVLKPCVFDMLKLSLRVLVVDNEENSLVALRIIFDLHKSYRPSLENQVQPFLEIVLKILKNIPVSARSMFTPTPKPPIPPPKPSGTQTHLSSSHSAPSLTSMAAAVGDTPAVPKPVQRPGSSTTPFLKSMDSFKVLTECPLIIMLLLQVYTKFILKNIPQMLPLMMSILGLQFSSNTLSPQLRVRYREFVASQVKILSLITYFLRDFAELLLPYEDTIANNVLVLIRFCPQESVSTRKELLVDFRHILASDFRKGFFKHLDFFIDETFLMGPGQQAYETLRPLAFSTIADLVHHAREYLSFAQLSKVVFMFAKSIHDVQLPVIIQTTSVRILMNIAEKFAVTTYQDSATFQRDRKLLSRILRTLIYKFDIINHQLEGTGGELAIAQGAGDFGGGLIPIFDTLQSDLLPSESGAAVKVDEERLRSDADSLSGSVMNERVFSSSINLAADSMKDVKSLIKNLLLALKVVLVSTSAMHKSAATLDSHGSNNSSNTASGVGTNTGISSMSVYSMTDDEIDNMKLFLRWALKSIDGVCTPPAPTADGSTLSCRASPKTIKTLNQQSGTKSQSTSTTLAAPSAATLLASNYETDQEVKDLLEPIVSVFSVLQPLSLIRSVLGENLDFIVVLSHDRPIFISLFHQLLMSTSSACSQLTMDTLLTFIVTKLPELRVKYDDNSFCSRDDYSKPGRKNKNYSSTLLKIFKVCLGIISVHPENEKVLRPRLCSIINISLRLASEAKYTLNYIMVIRTLFRSISGGKFEHAYKEMNVVLPTLLKGFGNLLQRSRHIETQNAILELSLTIPCRLDTMLLHFPFLLEMFCRAVTAKKSDSLPNLALRTLEFWTDNLKPDYLFSLMSSKPELLHRIFTGICLHLKPPPYPYGSLAARVLGKFGGKNTRFLRNFFSPELSGSGSQHLIGDQPNISTSRNAGCSKSASVFSVHFPHISPGDDAAVISIDDSVSSACSVLGDLVSTYVIKEVEIMSVDPAPCEVSTKFEVNQSPSLKKGKQELAEAIDNILESRREVSQSSFQCHNSDSDESAGATPPFSINLYNNISAETAAVVQSVVDSQVESSFNLIKSTLMQVLPVLPAEMSENSEGKSGGIMLLLQKAVNEDKRNTDSFSVFEAIIDNEDIDCGDEFPHSLCDADSFQNLLTKMVHSLICSTIFPQLRAKSDVSSFVEGLCFHLAILDSLAFRRSVGSYEPTVYSCAMNEAIMQCLQETRVEVYRAGVVTLKCWLAAISAVSKLFPPHPVSRVSLSVCSLEKDEQQSAVSFISSSPLEYFIFHAVDLCSSSTLWAERMTGVRAINELCKHLPPQHLRDYDRDIIESLLSTVHISEFERYASVLEDVICTLNLFILSCYSPPSLVRTEVTSGGGDKDPENGVEDQMEVDDDGERGSALSGESKYFVSTPSKECVQVLYTALESSKILVRVAARSGLLKIIQYAKQCSKESPFELILPEIVDFFSHSLGVSTITPPTLGLVSKMSFLLSHLPSGLVLDHDILVRNIDRLVEVSKQLEDSVSKSFPPFHHSLLNLSITGVSDPSDTSHGFQIADKEVIKACSEENIEIVIASFPLATHLGIELRSHMINLLGSLFSCPNMSKEVSLDVSYMPFRDRCIDLLHQSLSLKWVTLIERARIQMISISSNCTLVFKDVYDNMKPILPLFEDIRNLSLPKLKTLEAMIRIVRNKSYLQLSWKLLDQLKHWTNPSRIMQLNLWPAGEEVMIAAAIINIFSILPWDDSGKTTSELHSEGLHRPPTLEKVTSAENGSSVPPLLLRSGSVNDANPGSGSTSNGFSSSDSAAPPIIRSSSGSTTRSNNASNSQTQFPIFFNRLVDIIMRIERVRCQYQCSHTVESPVLIAFTRLLEAFPENSLDFFLESVNLSRSDVIHLLLDLFSLSSRCPKFMTLLLSEKGSSALKQCIDIYCDSVRIHKDSGSTFRGNNGVSPNRSDGLLFSAAIQTRLADAKNASRPSPPSSDGAEVDISLGSEQATRTASGTTPSFSAPSSSLAGASGGVSGGLQPMRTNTPSPSSVMTNDVLSSPLLLSSYQLQPPNSNMTMLLDKNCAKPPLPASKATLQSNSSQCALQNLDVTEDSICRASSNTIRIVQKLCALRPDFMAEHPDLLQSLRVMLILFINKNNFSVATGSRDPGPLKSSSKTCSVEELKATTEKIDSKFQEHFEIKTICESLLDHYRRNTGDILILFDLMPVLCTPCTLDFSFLLQFFKLELSALLSFKQKRDVLHSFLSLCEAKTVSGELKVKTLQIIIIPLLLQLFRDNDYAEVKEHVLDIKTIKLIMKNAFFSGEVMAAAAATSTSTAGAPSQHPPLASPIPTDAKGTESFGEPMNIELLKVATLLIEHCSKELVDNRKDLIKFAWNHLKTEDVTTKHWAYVNVCRFISAYDTPPKIILQVYVALLRASQIEHRELITIALDTLVPALPKRLRYEDFVKAMKWTKKIVFEEGHSLPLLIHVWNLIVRHSSLFYPFRAHFVPQMVSSISRLGLPPNCPVSHRHVALGCAEVLIGWELIRYKRIEKRAAETFFGDVERGEGSNVDKSGKDTFDGMDISVEDEKNSEVAGSKSMSAEERNSVSAAKERSGSSTSTSSSSSNVSSSVIKINDKDDEFALHHSMVQMLANFLVRLGLYAADNRDRAINKLAEKCISLYGTLVTIVPMKGIKVVYFERLLVTFTDNYNAASAGKHASSGSEKAAAAALALAHKTNNKAAATAALAMMQKNKKGDKTSKSGPGDPKAYATNISEKIFCTFLQFLTASLNSLDPKDSLFFDNIVLVKRLIAPFFLSEHMMKPILGDLFRKLILKSVCTFSLHKTPEEIKSAGFFQELSNNIDQVITKDYHEVESEAAAAALAANSFNRMKDGKGSSGSAIGKDNYAVCYWTLQFLHDICALSPSWIENHGTSLVSLSILFMTLHLNKVTKNCSKIDMSSANRSSLSSGKGGLLVNACTNFPTSQIAITAEVQQHPSYLLDTGTEKVNPNIAIHQNNLMSSLILLVKLLGSAQEMGYMRSQRDFTFSIMHSILEYSDDYTLWGLVVTQSCKWIARPYSPLSPIEQGMLFNKITNIERWAMDVHAQCAMLRVVALIEVVTKKSDNGSISGLKKLFSSKYTLPVGVDGTNSNLTDSLPLRALGILCTDARLRDLCASRLLQSTQSGAGSEDNSMFKDFITIFDMNCKPFEKLYWPATLTPLLLSKASGFAIQVAKFDGVQLEPLSTDVHINVEVAATHPYYSFLRALQTSRSTSFVEENNMVLQSLKTLPLVSPTTGDSFWKQCLEKVWEAASSTEQKLLTNVITRNVACHNYIKCFSWPEKLANASASSLPHNIPQSIMQFMLSLPTKPNFPLAFLGAVGCGYRLWHTMGDAIEHSMQMQDNASEMSSDESEHATRVLVALYSDAGDDDAMVDLYRLCSRCPRTSVALDLEIYGFYSEAQGNLFRNMKECLGSSQALDDAASIANVPNMSGNEQPLLADEPSLSVSEVEMEVWEERWMHGAKKLSQWDVLFDYSVKMNVEDVALESSSMLGNWPKVNRLLLAMPSNNASISIQVERGGIIPNPEIKMYEAMINIVDSKPHRSEKVVLSAIETSLHKWHSLPPLCGASSNATHKWLLHTFHRVVELRESMNMIAEVMKSTLVGKGSPPPDLKGNLLTWRERLPEVWDDMHKWDTLLHWRLETFSLIKKSFQSRNLDESQLACAHDIPWTTVMHAKSARKHSLSAVSSKILHKLKDVVAMDVFDAYSKLREQILTFLPSSNSHTGMSDCGVTCGSDLDKGLNIINNTNLEYFDAEQKAELFRLKAIFQSQLEDRSPTTSGHAASQQSFAQSVQVCPTYAKGWLSWGDLCFDMFNISMNSSHGASSAVRNTNMEYALSTIVCILKAVECNSEPGRILLSRAILLVTTADDSSSTLATALVSHGEDLPAWVWIPHLPSMLKALYRCVSCRAQMATLLCVVATAFPEAVVHQLMALDVDDISEAMGKILQQIENTIQSTKPELLSCTNWFTRDVERKFSPYHFSWVSITFLDGLLRKVLDDFSCRLNEVVPVKYLAEVDAFLLSEVTSAADPPRTLAKRSRGKSREVSGPESSCGTDDSAPMLLSEEALKRKFAKEFEGLSKAKKSKKLKLSEFTSLLQRWLAIFSACCMTSTGANKRLTRYRFNQSKLRRCSSTGNGGDEVYISDFCPSGDGHGRGHEANNDSILSSIEIPGLYALSSSRFREPRPDLHARLLRVFPRVRRVLLTGEAMKYQLQLLGSDGKQVAYNVSLKSTYTVSSSGNESLFGQCTGFIEWCLQQHPLTRAKDICISHPPTVALRRLRLPPESPLSGVAAGCDEMSIPSSAILPTHGPRGNDPSNSSYSLTRACYKEESLANMCYSQGQGQSSKSLSSLVQSWNDAVQVRQEIEVSFLETVAEGGCSNEEAIALCFARSKQEAYSRAMERNRSVDLLKCVLLSNWSRLLRNNNGEVYYSLRKTLASQLGVLGAVSYILQSSAPSPREYIFSTHDGRVSAYNMKPSPESLTLSPNVSVSSEESSKLGEGVNAGRMDVDMTAGEGETCCLRLTPAVVGALSMRLVNSTLRSALGNTAIAISKQRNVIETIMTSYCLDGISRSLCTMTDNDMQQSSQSHLIAKSYAASFVERCILLAPQPQDIASEDDDHSCDALVVRIVSQSLITIEQPPPNRETSSAPASNSVTVVDDISWARWI